MECLGHSLIEGLAGLLPLSWVFRLGEALGSLIWHFMPHRRRIILRNLRIAFAGEMDLPEIHRMARASFRRSGANLLCAAHSARLTPEKLAEVIHIENLELLETALATGKGVVLLLAHMGNWEILSRIVHLFPPGSKTGAFYRPLNNPLLDARVLARRQADGTRMFSKRDPFHQVTGFLREGGIVGILADQRVGMQGEVVPFFGRLTRASPLPSLLARRAKAEVLALSLRTVAPGKWQAVFMPVDPPPTTPHCMVALENAMRASLIDVFWLQERWKLPLKPNRRISEWLGNADLTGPKHHRILIWLIDTAESWQLPDAWRHKDMVYEAAVTAGRQAPAWLPETWRIHTFAAPQSPGALLQAIRTVDEADTLAIDCIIAPMPAAAMMKACKDLQIPLLPLP